MCAAGFAVFAYLQFGYHVESLEMYYFSSTLWGVICLTLAVILAELCRSSAKQRVARWLPPWSLLPSLFATRSILTCLPSGGCRPGQLSAAWPSSSAQY